MRDDDKFVLIIALAVITVIVVVGSFIMTAQNAANRHNEKIECIKTHGCKEK